MVGGLSGEGRFLVNINKHIWGVLNFFLNFWNLNMPMKWLCRFLLFKKYDLPYPRNFHY